MIGKLLFSTIAMAAAFAFSSPAQASADSTCYPQWKVKHDGHLAVGVAAEVRELEGTSLRFGQGVEGPPDPLCVQVSVGFLDGLVERGGLLTRFVCRVPAPRCHC